MNHGHSTGSLTQDLHATAADWQWSGTWNQFVGKAKQLWGNKVTYDFDTIAEGKYQHALGLIEQRTGEAMDAIYHRFSR